MKVIYSLSTLPFYSKTPNGSFALDKFELYTAVLSSVTRRRAGNTVVMHCDSRGYEYFKGLGLEKVWDGMRVSIPDDFEGIDPSVFWAAGKLFALRQTACPVLMLDTDFIAWQLPELKQLTAAHRENLSDNIYPDVGRFNMMDGYVFNPAFDYTVRPLNTAFLYINDEGFKKYYTDEAVRFMKSAEAGGDPLTYMVFAEQRLLALLAAQKGVEVDTVMESPHSLQGRYTHTWGAKQVMRDVPSEGERFCEKCRQRIRKDFPEMVYVIDIIEENS